MNPNARESHTPPTSVRSGDLRARGGFVQGQRAEIPDGHKDWAPRFAEMVNELHDPKLKDLVVEMLKNSWQNDPEKFNKFALQMSELFLRWGKEKNPEEFASAVLEALGIKNTPQVKAAGAGK